MGRGRTTIHSDASRALKRARCTPSTSTIISASSTRDGRGIRRPVTGERRRRLFRLPPGALLKVGLYYLACWSVVAVIVGRSPATLAAVAGFALYTTIPLFVFLRWGGWPFYPRKVFRLFVLRVFWYTQLALPLVAGAGVIGVVIGAPFGRAIDGGRMGAAILAATLGVFIGIGYIGSRALVVRDVVAELPDLPPEFDGFRIVQLTDLHIGPHLSRRTPRARRARGRASGAPPDRGDRRHRRRPRRGSRGLREVLRIDARGVRRFPDRG